MLKLTCVLTAEQAGPYPVSTETLWCRPEGGNYRLRNIPFFIDEVALDDVVAVAALPDGFFEIKCVIAESGNSTLWIYFKSGAREDVVMDELRALGCGAEAGVLDGYYAINVPKTIDIDMVYSVVDRAVEGGEAIVDYPAIRHR